MKKQPKNLLANFLNKTSQEARIQTADGDANIEAQRKIVMKDIYELEDNPKNFYSMKDIESFATMLSLSASIPPLEIALTPEGKFMIWSGHRRKQAIIYGLEHGMTFPTDNMVPCIIRNFDAEAKSKGDGLLTAEDFEVIDLIFPNKGQRREFTIKEEVTEIDLLEPIYRKIYESEKEAGNLVGMKFRTYFANAMGMSETRLQRLIDYKKLSPEVQLAIEEDRIKFTAAVEMANLSQEEQNNIILGLQDQGTEMTGKAVKEARAKVEKKARPPQTKPAAAEDKRTANEAHNETENLGELEAAGQTVLPNPYTNGLPTQEDFSHAQFEGDLEIHPLDIPEEYGQLSVILLKKENGYVAGFRFKHATEIAEEIPEEDDIAKPLKEEVIQDEILFLKKYGTPKVREALVAGGYIEKEADNNAEPLQEEITESPANPFKEIKESLRNRIVRVELARDSDQLKEQLLALRTYVDETIEKILD